MYFGSESWGKFGCSGRTVSHTCRECSRFRPMAAKKCDKRKSVKGDTFSCKHFLFRSDKGFR